MLTFNQQLSVCSNLHYNYILLYLIADRSKGLYLDTLNNKKYKIQDAIQKGLVVAEEVTSKGDGANEIVTNKESTFTLIGVKHPVTGEILSVSKVGALALVYTQGIEDRQEQKLGKLFLVCLYKGKHF